MRNLLVLIVLAVSSLLTSCGQVSSEDLAPELIKTHYYASYSMDEEKLSVHGEFKLNATTYVSLDGESRLRVDNQVTKMKQDILGVIKYEYTENNVEIESQRSFDLKYFDKEGIAYQNSISLPSKFSVELEEEIDPEQDLVLNFKVDQENDNATTMVASISYGDGILYSYEDTELKEGKIIFENSSLQNLRASFITVYICRIKRGQASNNPGAGGRTVTKICQSKETYLK